MIALNETEKAKELLLNAVSSEHSSLSSTFLGLSVILFAYHEVVSQIYSDGITFSFHFAFPESVRFILVFSVSVVIVTLIVFTILRVIFLGRVSNRILRFDSKVASSRELWDLSVDSVKEHPILRWFSQGIVSSFEGFVFSLIIGFAISLVLFWAFLFN